MPPSHTQAKNVQPPPTFLTMAQNDVPALGSAEMKQQEKAAAQGRSPLPSWAGQKGWAILKQPEAANLSFRSIEVTHKQLQKDLGLVDKGEEKKGEGGPSQRTNSARAAAPSSLVPVPEGGDLSM